jgi:hypothetical protein
MVALKSLAPLQLRRILTTFRKRCPDCPVGKDAAKAKDPAVFHIGKERAAIFLVPAPIPWADLEGPCATAWWWPQATQRMKKHKGHVIVTLMGSPVDPLERHIRLTHLVCAVAANTDAAGIYWGAGTVVHEPKAFQKESVDLAPDNLAPHLWIDMRLEQQKDESFRFFTTGMRAFGLMEIEIDKSRQEPEEILDLGAGIVQYVVMRGANIKDGETVGRSADEKLKVRHRKSMFDRGKVMKVAFQ